MRPRTMNWTGKRVGILTIICEAPQRSRERYWLCRCDCGNEKPVASAVLTRGVKSCGCLTAQILRSHAVTHGMHGTTVHARWERMMQRCARPGRYTDLGIRVCERWQVFEHFLADMGEPPTPAHTLDRIDNSKGYESGNCRWATMREQQNNRSNNRLIQAFGRTQTLQQWADEMQINQTTLGDRLSRGWPIERALKEPRRTLLRQTGKRRAA